VTVTIDPKESARRRSLDDSGLLDSPAEERYDRITRLARLSFDVMLSTFTLIDHDRAWIKSCAGGERSETPREDSLCTHTVIADSPIVVSDVTQDDRFAELPAVTGPLGIRFYAGFPVHDRDGTAIGTLCLYDTRPRTLDRAGMAVMAELTSWVESELAAPASTQEPFEPLRPVSTPRLTPQMSGFEAAAFCYSTSGNAGHYFDHQQHGDIHAFAVADVVGSRSGSAMFMASVGATPSSADGANTLDDALARVNDQLIEGQTPGTSFMTGFFGCADPATGVVRYVDAGHGLSVVVRADGSAERLARTDLPLGISGSQRWVEHTVTLHPGDDLVCFSNGVVNLMGGAPDAVPALMQLVEDADAPRGVVDFVQRLTDDVALPDDITVLAIRRTQR
jgi:sigma-B regulation protein RsbU (phosphoserine phosphatase)